MAQTASIVHETADVNGVTLHYAQSGTGQLMLFLHGFPEFWYGWKNQLDDVRRDHLAVAPDMRGYNLSSKPAGSRALPHPAARRGRARPGRKARPRTPTASSSSSVTTGVVWSRGRLPWRIPKRRKLVIVNAPHPAVFQRELRENPAQQKASAYMLMFRGPDAEKTLSANNYQMLVNTVLGAGLKEGHFTEADKKAYLEAWSQPGALTGGLNYYRAAQVGPPAGAPRPGSQPPRRRCRQ